MNPLEPLIEEHRQIRVVISAITALVGLARDHRRISPAPFLELQHFIQRFADGAHHAKEEQVLFYEMVRAGIPYDSGPLNCMLSEHEQGQKHAEVMGAAARACLGGAWERQAEMIESAEAWCQLLTAHTEKEDLMLYAIAQRVLDAQTLAGLPARFERVDPNPAGLFKGAAQAVVEAAAQAAHQRRATG